MFKIEGIDMEFPQMGKEPKIGYSNEYIEKNMMSGKIRRIYKGKRLVATFTYAFLTDSQRNILFQLLTTQSNQGYVNVEIDNPFGTFSGEALIEINNDQSRFCYSEVLNDYVWTNFTLSIKGVGYDN